MKITRKLALRIIKYLIDNPKFYFPFIVQCKGFQGLGTNKEYISINPNKKEFNILKSSGKYDDFNLYENLQNLDLETVQLMSKGFIEKILIESKV